MDSGQQTAENDPSEETVAWYERRNITKSRDWHLRSLNFFRRMCVEKISKTLIIASFYGANEAALDECIVLLIILKTIFPI